MTDGHDAATRPANPRGPWSPLSPHQAEPVTLTCPAGPINALRITAPDQATTPMRTVLMVPGYTGSKEDFAPLLDPCAAAGHEVLAIDLPGQNGAPGPDEEKAYLPAALGEHLAALVATLAADGPVTLLGHSYGGLVARAAVLAGAPITGLTLLASGPADLTSPRRLAALAQGEELLRTGDIASAYAVREAMYAQDPGWAVVPEALKTFLRTRFLSTSAACLLGMAEGLRSEPDRVTELRAALQRTGVPALVVTGAGDDAWSVPEQRDMAERLRVPFALVEGAAHSPNTENPAGLLEVLLQAWARWPA